MDICFEKNFNKKIIFYHIKRLIGYLISQLMLILSKINCTINFDVECTCFILLHPQTNSNIHYIHP